VDRETLMAPAQPHTDAGRDTRGTLSSGAEPVGSDSAAIPVLHLDAVTKTYGHTTAVRDASLRIRPGEMIAIAGHNGAGKTTLMKIVGGIVERDSGEIIVNGDPLPARFSARAARERGLALAFQEINLFPDLRVVEHVGVMHQTTWGPGWRRKAASRIGRQLDEMFPSHGISPSVLVDSLSLAQRQMLQIALSALHESPLRLLILDEPTSSLTDDLAERLFSYLRRVRQEEGLSVILVSHKMSDILGHTDRTIVMRDGATVSDRVTRETSLQQIMEDMGASPAVVAARPAPRHVPGVMTASPPMRAGPPRAASRSDAEPVVLVRDLEWRGLRRVSLTIGPGEIVGLAGLVANGQQEILEAIWQARRRFAPWRVRRSTAVTGSLAYVSGDRQEQGLFPLWSVAQNLTIGHLGQLQRLGLVDRRAERVEAREWISRLSIKADPGSRVTSLSGGTQQKVLLARGLLQAPRLLILDDPFRGVDITTKTEAYQRLREFTGTGSSVLWYTSENSELLECDRVYVLRDRTISAELTADQLTAEQLIVTSFGESAESDGPR